MKRTQLTRLAETEQRLANMPVPPHLVDSAIKQFAKTGELPENDKLARAVTARALEPKPGSGDWMENIQQAIEIVRLASDAPEELRGYRRRDQVRRILFREAVSREPLTRGAARQVLILIAKCEFDLLAELPFDRDIEIPEFGRLGLHMLDWPSCLRMAPFEEVADRLFERIEQLQGAMDDIEGWRDKLDNAVRVMRTTGELPEPGLLRQAALVDGLLMLLMRYSLGHEVGEAIIALDAAASDDGEATRAAALYRDSQVPIS